MKNIINSLKKQNLSAFNQWKKTIEDIKSKKILDSYRSEKLKNALSKIPTRTLKDSFDRLIGDGSKVKGALLSILHKLKQKPRSAFGLWKSFVNLCNTKSILDNLRSQKLVNSLTRIPSRSSKDAFQRISGSGSKAVGALKSLFMALEKLPRRAFLNWKDFIIQCKTKGLLNNLKSTKLKSALTLIPLRTLRSIFITLTPSQSLLKRALRGLCLVFEKRLKLSIQNWSDYLHISAKKAQEKKVKAMIIKDSLSKPSRRVLRSVKSHVDHDNSKLRLALKVLSTSSQKLYRDSFTKWSHFTTPAKLIQANKGHSLKSSLLSLLTRSLRKVLIQMTDNSKLTKKHFSLMAMITKSTPREAFSIWVKSIYGDRNKKLLQSLLARRLEKSMEKCARHKLKDSFLRVMGNGDKVKGAFNTLASVFYRRLRQAYRSWNNFKVACDKKILLDSGRSQKLINILSKINSRTTRTAMSRIQGGGNEAKGKLASIFKALEKLPLKAFGKWKQFINDVKSKRLFDEVRAQKLKSALSRVTTRTMSSFVNKFSPNNYKLVKKALKDLARTISKQQSEAYSEWKSFVNNSKERELLNKIRGLKLKEKISSTSKRSVNSCYTRVVGGGSLVRGVFNRMASKWSDLLKNSFKTYQNNSKIRSQAQETQACKLKIISMNILKIRLRQVFVSFFIDGRVVRLLNRLFGTYANMQKKAFQELWGRVERWRTIHKINSAYFVFRQLLSYAKRVQECRFKYWKNLEFLRKRRMMRKSTTKMMKTVSLNYEGALWRWKTIVTKTDYHVTPKHSLAFKRFILTGTNYQKRLLQYSYYKIALYYRAMLSGGKLSLPLAIAHMNKQSRDLSSADNPLANLLEQIKSVENPSISTATSNKLSKDEVASMNQLGAFELLIVQLKSAQTRKLACALASIFTYSKQISYYDSERSRLIEQINDLRFEKHSLLEDNNTLRLHNENLIDNLEKSNIEFQALSLNLDNMRLVRMVRVLSKMVEVPMAEAFLELYDNQE